MLFTVCAPTFDIIDRPHRQRSHQSLLKHLCEKTHTDQGPPDPRSHIERPGRCDGRAGRFVFPVGGRRTCGAAGYGSVMGRCPSTLAVDARVRLAAVIAYDRLCAMITHGWQRYSRWARWPAPMRSISRLSYRTWRRIIPQGCVIGRQALSHPLESLKSSPRAGVAALATLR